MNEQKQFQEKFNQLSEVEKNDIYRAVLYEYVREDADYRSEWLGIEALSDEHLDEIAYRYAYEKEYDNSLSYWTNIENLIKRVYWGIN